MAKTGELDDSGAAAKPNLTVYWQDSVVQGKSVIQGSGVKGGFNSQSG